RCTCFLFRLCSGETQFNRDKLLQGVDTVLSARGLQQAEAAGRHLRGVRFTNAFVSNLQRARQVRSAAAARRLSCVLQGFGIAEGLPKEALKNMANAAGQSCRDFTPGRRDHGVRKRFRKFLKSLFQRMATDHGFPEAGADVAHPAAQDEDGLGQLHAHALVVSHGAYIRVAVRHLVEELQCSLPPGSRVGQVFGACPNTGMCRFVVTLSRGETGPQPHAVHCLFVNRKEHLGGDED
uniref:Uncharacterized protein n=1 Tax=Denticeps clupeoides TaxID=299321 RepID=A0AAY4BKP4_9TELE